MQSGLLKLALTLIILSAEIIGSPLKFPESNSDIRSLERQPAEDSEPRFHHHKKKKFHKFGCGQGNFHKRHKRQSHSEGRFFFPILNYYDTDIIVSNGHPGGSDCGSINEKPTMIGNPPLGGLVGFGNIGSGLGSGLGSLGSGLGNLGSDLSSGLGSLFPSIGNGIPLLGSGAAPSQPARPPAPVVTRPPPPVFTPPPATRPPIIVSPPQTSTDSGDDGDSEDYDYTDFSTTVRSRPLPGTVFTGHRPMPITNPLVNSIKPVYERPETYFNRYIVRPINRTLREFYSLF